ncbi:E3 ubiquitin-protein ligase TRIM71-like [Mytilus edulis]|uniref:E3 ubiquitin-protein ligase TRIM71-like n=1 Tax=Mytilus edulis TaxID=6550 RepID=UPI0039EE9C3D
MSSSKLTVCGVCEYRNINKPSVVWCSECNEGLCEECKDHHAASRGSRNHSIVPVSEYQNLPSGILEITQICPTHDDKYVIFCKKHDTPCCRRCVTETHNECKEIDVIDDVIKNVKSSNAFLEIEHSLAELSENLQRIREDRQENIKSLIENRAKIEKEVHQTRISINNHLDKLQETLMKELYVAEEKESTKIKNIITSIQENERKISESQTTFDKIKQHASDLQTFLALKHIQRDVMNNEQFLESLKKGEKMNHACISWKTENAVEIIPTTIKKMGIITLDTRSYDATLTNRKNKQAQIMMTITHIPNIDDIKLTLRQTVNSIGSDVSDCTLLPDGRIIFSCFGNSKIHVIKPDGTLDFTLEPGFSPSHIFYIDESQKLVVTSSLYNYCISIIDIKNRKTEKSINVGSHNYGIVHKDGKLFYNGYTHGLCVVKLEDNSVTKLVNVPLSPLSSIAIWLDNLYFITKDRSLTCCDLQGGIKRKFKLEAYLKEPRGITVDNYGRVYVSGFESNNIGVISPDGNTHRVLLSEKDGLKNPKSMCFDRKNNKLLVANIQNVAFLYEVSR